MNLELIEVADFLRTLGMRNVKENGSEVHYSCPFPGHLNGDKKPSASMQQGSTVAHCFSCGWSGNAVSFLADLEQVSPLKAMQWIREEYGDGFKEPSEDFVNEIEQLLTPKVEVDDEEVQVLDEGEAEKRRINFWTSPNLSTAGLYGYLPSRGFSGEILEEFDIGWDTISQRFTIPIRDELGNLIGFKARTPDPEVKPKYLVLGGAEYGFEPYPTAKVIFGLHRVDKEIEESQWREPRHWVLCEGELNAIAVCQAGYFGLGISGKFLSDYQAKLLHKYPGPITLVFDEQEDAISAARKLEPYLPVTVAPKHERDPADLTAKEISLLLGSSSPSILL